MKINSTIHELIDRKIIEAREEREPSGRLSASKLGWSLQWQMLHYFKVPSKPIDLYTERKFQRGKDVEDRIMKWIAPSPDKMQVRTEYRGVVGFADVVMDYPIEVKSVTNANFKYRQKNGMTRSHKLQAELYAKGLGFDTYAIAYVASDDYRVLCIEEKVSDEVDRVIDEYEAQIAKGTIPVFEAKEAWHSNSEYNPYPDWMKLSEEEITKKYAEFLGSKK